MLFRSDLIKTLEILIERISGGEIAGRIFHIPILMDGFGFDANLVVVPAWGTVPTPGSLNASNDSISAPT